MKIFRFGISFQKYILNSGFLEMLNKEKKEEKKWESVRNRRGNDAT